MAFPHPTKDEAADRFPVMSDAIEPAFAHIFARLFARLECFPIESRTYREDAWRELWEALRAMGDIARVGSTCCHASVVVTNHRIEVAAMIRDELGIDPFKEPSWVRGGQ